MREWKCTCAADKCGVTLELTGNRLVLHVALEEPKGRALGSDLLRFRRDTDGPKVEFPRTKDEWFPAYIILAPEAWEWLKAKHEAAKEATS